MNWASFDVAERTTLDDVQRWGASARNLTFRVLVGASFTVGVEGVAVGAIQAFKDDGRDIDVTCTWDLDPTRPATFGPFATIFGLGLLRAARVLLTPAGKDLRSSMLDALWKRVREGNGRLGIGDKAYLVARDPDVPLPRLLAADESSFPDGSGFRSAFTRVAETLGWRKDLTRTEDDAITFLYEASHNAHIHGCVRTSGGGTVGYRGIILERISFERNVPPALTGAQLEYFERIRKETTEHRLLMAFTVTDLGQGIHRTLEREPGEGDWEVFLRAFKDGVTRQAQTGDIGIGRGLGRLRSAALLMKAWLMVRSGSLVGTTDFTAEATASVLQPMDLKAPVDWAGTSLTLLWPSVVGGGLQTKLIP